MRKTLIFCELYYEIQRERKDYQNEPLVKISFVWNIIDWA